MEGACVDSTFASEAIDMLLWGLNCVPQTGFFITAFLLRFFFKSLKDQVVC